MTYYKVLNHDGTPFHGGYGKWWLPSRNKSGKWMPQIENIALCARGYHVVNKDQLINWLGPAIFEVEVKGKFIYDKDKSVFESARLIRKLDTWNDKTARLFAADCADHVLPIFEAKFPEDHRPRKAIAAARQFANGKITDAAWAAAWDAARAAAGAAAGAAARAAAWAAAGAATGAAAGAAARAAAWAAAWAAARAATGAAAGAATGAAAGAAAGAATGAAAGAAAWAATWAAERAWQTERLFKYLKIERVK